MEYVGIMAKQQNHTESLACRLCDWQQLDVSLPPAKRFESIVAVDPVTMCGVRPNLLVAFYELLASRLAVGGKLAVLAFYAAPALVAAERHSPSFFKNAVLRGAELPTREEVAAAAAQAGLEEVRRDGAGGLGGNYAATMRHWRLQLPHAWRACADFGATDTKLRQCAALSRCANA